MILSDKRIAGRVRNVAVALERKFFHFPAGTFDEQSAHERRRLYGVDYVTVTDPLLGEIFITREGWPLRDWLQPGQWYSERRYSSIGERLPGGTGTVYRVPTETERGKRELVVKFSRFAQEIPAIDAEATFPPNTPADAIYGARFNNPFEEFGLLRDLRRGHYGPRELRILTKRSLAIYSPSQEYAGWRLGRDDWLFEHAQHEVDEAQPDASVEHVSLNARRQYILLFQWVKGEDALTLHKRRRLSLEDLDRLSHRVNHELSLKGFRVLDNKPSHFILRPRNDGTLLRKNADWVYALVDFELLQRTEDYKEYLIARTNLSCYLGL